MAFDSSTIVTNNLVHVLVRILHSMSFGINLPTLPCGDLLPTLCHSRLVLIVYGWDDIKDLKSQSRKNNHKLLSLKLRIVLLDSIKFS